MAFSTETTLSPSRNESGVKFERLTLKTALRPLKPQTLTVHSCVRELTTLWRSAVRKRSGLGSKDPNHPIREQDGRRRRIVDDQDKGFRFGRHIRNLHFFFQAEDGIRDLTVTGVQTCALPI